MISKFVLNCISDEIHHPIITKLYRAILIIVILATVLLALLNNDPHLHIQYKDIIYPLQNLFYFFIFIDFLLRIIGSLKHYDMEDISESKHYNTLKSYLFSYYGIIDFLAILPFFMILLKFDSKDLNTVLSIMTLLKLARFSPALIILKDVIVSERKSLLAALYLMMILTLSISTILYFIERNINPNGFKTLLDSIWWAIITLSTVGYGDVVPITPLGKLLGGMAAITGFGMFALPAGILANGFADEIRRLRDITNWKMVAKVPLFSNLEFGAIADIAQLLHIKRFRKDELIIKENDNGNSMYFILEGSVIVHKQGLYVILSEGDFFGEIALLKNIPRTASISAKNRCELLELTTYDFQNFIKTQPELLEKIEKIATLRYDLTSVK